MVIVVYVVQLHGFDILSEIFWLGAEQFREYEEHQYYLVNSNSPTLKGFFDDELGKSLMIEGFKEPLIVRIDEHGKYFIVDGFHRYRNGLKQGIKKFPCVLG
jgi:hypothetical protein